jgi:hypothetical protein
MNERIRELALQAGGEFWQRLENDAVKQDAYITFDPPESLEKFVESIVKDCIAVCDATSAEYLKHQRASDDFQDKNIYAEGRSASDLIKHKIKKQFGVK